MAKKIIFFSLFVLLTLVFPKISFAEDFKLYDVEYDPITKSIVLKTSKEVKPEIMKIDNPPRTVIDLPSTVFEQVSKKIDVNDGFIKQVRVAQFRVNPSVVRISVDVLKHIDFDVKNVADDSDDKKQIIKITALEFEKSKITINNDIVSKYKKTRIAKKLLEKNSIEAFEYSGDKITISGKSKISYEISKDEKNNDYYSIKLFDFSMNGLRDIPVRPNQKIESIKIEEKNEHSTIYFKLKPNTRLAAKPTEANKIEVFSTEGPSMVTTDPMINTRNNNYVSVDFTESENNSKVYLTTSNNSLKYKVFELANPDRLVIDTFGTSINGFDDPFAKKYSRIVQRVRYGYLDKNDNQAEGIRLVFELKKKISIHENLQNNKTLEVSFVEDMNQVPVQTYANVPKAFDRNKKVMIVLDPGHGGHDPGAIGHAGVREKDVTLGVTYYVRQMLLENGMAVLMARADDSEILLQPRVDVANNNAADLFVSVHCNAMDGASPRGVETYYRTPQSDGFAKVMHKNMINTLGVPDRGVRVRNFFVIRKTVMPSVLIEIGYVTNPVEEEQLNSPSYQKRVATAIYKGIKEYLGNQPKI